TRGPGHRIRPGAGEALRGAGDDRGTRGRGRSIEGRPAPAGRPPPFAIVWVGRGGRRSPGLSIRQHERHPRPARPQAVALPVQFRLGALGYQRPWGLHVLATWRTVPDGR